MADNKNFNIDICPQNDYLIDKDNNDLVFANKTKMFGYTTNDLVVFYKDNNTDNVLSIYAKLLNLSKHSETLYKYIVGESGTIYNHSKFQKLYCVANKISRLTYNRALTELICRGIVKKEDNKIFIVDKYNIYNHIHNKRALIIIL